MQTTEATEGMFIFLGRGFQVGNIIPAIYSYFILANWFQM